MSTLTPKNVLPVLVVGSLNMDFIGIVKKHTARRYHQHFDNDLQRPGGHGANQAVAVHRASHCKPDSCNNGLNACGSWISGQPAPTYSLDFDIQVSLVGMVGDEGDHGELIKKELEKNHVNTQGVGLAEGFKTGFAHIRERTSHPGKDKKLVSSSSHGFSSTGNSRRYCSKSDRAGQYSENPDHIQSSSV